MPTASTISRAARPVPGSSRGRTGGFALAGLARRALRLIAGEEIVELDRMTDGARVHHAGGLDEEGMELFGRGAGMRAHLRHVRDIALRRADPVDDEVARAPHRHEVAQAAQHRLAVSPVGKGPSLALAQPIHLPAPVDEGPLG